MPAPTASASSGSPTSRTMRMRLREKRDAGLSLFAASTAGAASGTTLREGSAITFLVFLLDRSLVGDRLPEVFAGAGELRQHHGAFVGVDSGEHGFAELLNLLLDPIEQRARGGSEVKPFGTAVVRVGAALDQA